MIRQIMTLATLCWMMAGCADEVLNRDGGKGEGRLLLTGIEVESAVGDVQTKASLAEEDLPEITDFTIEVVSASNGLTVKILQPGTTHCTLSVGSYLLKASYGDPTALSYTPAFMERLRLPSLQTLIRKLKLKLLFYKLFSIPVCWMS